jgi:bifunctional DNA-binding transcriptional regulator/antitoxin component of YhaV-PrlF toxin-antitoxin module
MSNDLEKGIAKIFLTNKISATLIIPIEIARKHGLNESSHVLVEETTHGILIRKLEV